MTAEEIFLKALEKQTPAERAAYLDGACAGDAELRSEVEALIASDQEAGNFLEQPLFNGGGATIDHAPTSEQAGSTIGPYKLLEKIGEGGFGVVFMAEQQKSIVRKVALKIIKPGMDTKEVVARFEAERQALALMDHPHIARVLDAGATESGRPYFVMELVRGIPITDYCDQNSLGFRERLELFTCVCQAVQHAHQKGIIHRDVKPTNVLVTLHDGKPVVKVIDFGVAKAIDRRLTERTLFTRFAEMVGTPLYMSPEQAEMSGLDVDTRTDIYSLGVLLYELLTGSTPFDKERLGKAAYDEIRRIIRDEEPPRPSTRVSTLGAKATAISAHRKTEPKKLSALLKGDLDWIVMKALEKDRTRRYETAKDFADDVQHFLNDQPVEAHAPSRVYRFQKFVRRYRVAATAVALIAATLVAATVFSASMAVSESRAREEMQVAKEAAEQATQLAEGEKQRALKAVADLETSLEIFGAALGTSESQRITSPDQAVSDMLDALVKRLDMDPVRNPYVEANVCYVIGAAYWSIQRPVAANTQFRRSLEARRKAVGGVDVKTAQTLSWVGLTDTAAGRPEDAEPHLRECVMMWRTVGGGEASIGEAQALGDLARSLVVEGRAEEALGIANDALALALKSGGKNHNITGWSAISIAECHGALGDADKQVAYLREALSSFEAIGVIGEQWDVWNRLGKAYVEQGRLLDAKDAFSRALQLSDGVGIMGLQKRHEATMSLSDVLCKLQDWTSAEKIHREFLVSVKGKLDENDSRLMAHRGTLIGTLIAQGNEKEAESVRETALSAADPEGQWQLWIDLGNLNRRLGKLFDAKDAFKHALQLSENLGDGKLERQGESAEGLFNVLADLRDWRAAESVSRQFLRSANGQIDRSNGQVVSHSYNLAWALEEQQRDKDAEQTRLELLLDVQRAVKDGKTVWWELGDRILCADLLIATKKDEASLQKALQILNGAEEQTKVADWLNGWYHANYSRLQQKLGLMQEAIQHARLSKQKSAGQGLWIEHHNEERLVELLRDAAEVPEAEVVLRNAVAEREKKFGDDHVITHCTRTDLAEFLMELNKYAEAEELLQQSQAGLLPDMRVPSSQKQRVIRLLGDVCEASGNAERAAQWRAKLEKSSATEPNELETRSPGAD